MRRKVIERKRWLLTGKKCRSISNEEEREIIFSHTDQDKWDDIQHQFILLHYWVKHPFFQGPVDQVYAKFIKEMYEVEPNLLKKIRSEMQKRNIKLSYLPCRTYLPLHLSDEKTIDQTTIKAYIRATAKFIGVKVDDSNEEYKAIRDGVYASLGLECPDRKREEAAAKRMRK